MDRALARFVGLYQHAFDERGVEDKMPVELVQAIVGGLRKVIYARLRRGQEEELSELAKLLAEWILRYQPPPVREHQRGLSGCWWDADWNDPARRIISAATESVAERGYSATRVGEIVERASTSLSTFYKLFDGKEDVFVAALDAGQAELFSETLSAFEGEKDWPVAVCCAFEAMVDFLATHPDFAQLAYIEIFSGTKKALERRDRTIEALLHYLAAGYERAPEVPAIAAEAIGGAVYELTYRRMRSAGTESLPAIAPLMSYVPLAPFVGAEEACEVANGGGRGEDSTSKVAASK
jgi:AcrR family transcriptional regulator